MVNAEARMFLKDDLMGFLSLFLLFVGIMFFFAQVPGLLARQTQLSGWLYVFPILSFVTGIKSKRDGVAWGAVIWFCLLFLVDVFYGVGGI